MTRVKALYRSEAIPFVAVSRSVHCAIVLSGSSRSANRVYAWATVPSTRVHDAVDQNKSGLITLARKQQKLRPQEMCFFLTSAFIELLRRWPQL